MTAAVKKISIKAQAIGTTATLLSTVFAGISAFLKRPAKIPYAHS